jgi:hypothetical protein
MPKLLSRTRNAALALGLALLLSACVIAPPRYAAGGYIGIAPPPPRLEYYGAPPYPGYFWIGGFWRWAPGGYVWMRGRWAAPRPGFRWEPRRWVHDPRGWHLAGGRWIRHRHR